MGQESEHIHRKNRAWYRDADAAVRENSSIWRRPCICSRTFQIDTEIHRLSGCRSEVYDQYTERFHGIR